MATLRIKEAISIAESNGKKIFKKDLASKIWPDSTPLAQTVNMANLCNGSTRRVEPAWIEILCNELGCTSDFLLGINQEGGER